MMHRNIAFILAGIGILILVADSTLIQMRVVKETAIYGYAGGGLTDSETPNQLIPLVQPSNFSGPILLQKLVGKCFNLTEERYRYIFCPFQNVTQYEVSARWNAYQGILGVWSHWEIVNNTFFQMVFKHGDQCGDINRSMKVSLKCGPKEELLNVTEPQKCQYSAIFSTRYVCHKDALLVYPRLSSDLRKDWDNLYTAYITSNLTIKEYKEGLEKIFLKAGYSEIPQKPEVTVAQHIEKDKFMDLLTCNKEYKKLHDQVNQLSRELEELKLLINHHTLSNRTLPII